MHVNEYKCKIHFERPVWVFKEGIKVSPEKLPVMICEQCGSGLNALGTRSQGLWVYLCLLISL